MSISRSLPLFLVLVTAVAAGPTPVMAQDDPAPGVALMAGATHFDLSGVNTAPVFALRVDMPFSPHLLGEASLSYANIDQQFGKSQLFIPELQVQLQGTWGRLAPYAGIGAGLAIESPEDAEVDTDVDFAPSGSLGLRAAVDERVGVRVEGRIHGIGADFTGTVAELTAGISIVL